MERSAHDAWTAALVIRGLRLAFLARHGPALPGFIVERAGEVLGLESPEYVALVLRTAPAAAGLSLRAMCREHYGWARSRSELYRRSLNGAMRVAAALNRAGIAVPGRLQTGPEP
jgi:hypothetical protein